MDNNNLNQVVNNELTETNVVTQEPVVQKQNKPQRSVTIIIIVLLLVAILLFVCRFILEDKPNTTTKSTTTTKVTTTTIANIGGEITPQDNYTRDGVKYTLKADNVELNKEYTYKLTSNKTIKVKIIETNLDEADVKYSLEYNGEKIADGIAWYINETDNITAETKTTTNIEIKTYLLKDTLILDAYQDAYEHNNILYIRQQGKTTKLEELDTIKGMKISEYEVNENELIIKGSRITGYNYTYGDKTESFCPQINTLPTELYNKEAKVTYTYKFNTDTNQLNLTPEKTNIVTLEQMKNSNECSAPGEE